MIPIDALQELFKRVAACRGDPVLVDAEELDQWPSVAVKAMKSQRILLKTHPASNVICRGCEDECVMPVDTLPKTEGGPVSFVICDKRNDINRVPIPIERLIQWQCSAEQICSFIATSIGLRHTGRQTVFDGLWEIGMAIGDKRSQMLCLDANGTLALVAGSCRMPLAELIKFHAGEYTIDNVMVRRLVDASTTADRRYTPSNARREARKLDTQAMYESWQKEYRNLKKKRPNMSDVWYSKQIAKMDIAKDRDAETIRKKMKK